jgi:hypothetical protein
MYEKQQSLPKEKYSQYHPVAKTSLCALIQRWGQVGLLVVILPLLLLASSRTSNLQTERGAFVPKFWYEYHNYRHKAQY